MEEKEEKISMEELVEKEVTFDIWALYIGKNIFIIQMWMVFCFILMK